LIWTYLKLAHLAQPLFVLPIVVNIFYVYNRGELKRVIALFRQITNDFHVFFSGEKGILDITELPSDTYNMNLMASGNCGGFTL